MAQQTLSANVPGDHLKAQGLLGAPGPVVEEPLGAKPKVHPFLKKVLDKLSEDRDFLLEPLVEPLTKRADLHPQTFAYDHQRRATGKWLTNGRRLIVAHGTGTGKTLTSLRMVEMARQHGLASRAIVVVPSALRNNFLEQGVLKHTNTPATVYGTSEEVGRGTHADVDAPVDTPYQIVSMESFRKDPVKWMKNTRADTLIVDEFHRAADEHSLTHKALKKARPMARNFIGLTGSVVSNSPSDIVPLIDIATNGNHPFGSRRQFEARFMRTAKGKRTLRDLSTLARAVAPYVDYFGTDQMRSSDMPSKQIDDVLVEMSPYQHTLFRYATGKLAPDVVRKLKKDITSLSDREIRHVFTRISEARKISNSIHTLDSRLSPTQSARSTPKVKRLLDDVEQHLKETPDGQVIAHTNLVHGGVDVLSAGLKDRGIPFGVFMGTGSGVTEAGRQQDVREYKAGEKKVLITSSAGSEGLNLPDTTFVASLDGHFNPERVLQAEARGRRGGGQQGRAPADRRVLIRRYVSIPPRGQQTLGSSLWDWMTSLFSWGKPEPRPQVEPLDVPSVDRWVYGIAERKHHLNQALRESLRKIGSAAVLDPPQSLREEYWERFGKRWADPKSATPADRAEEERFIQEARNAVRARSLAPYTRELMEAASTDPVLLLAFGLLTHMDQGAGDLTPAESARLTLLSDENLAGVIRGDKPPAQPKVRSPIRIGDREERSPADRINNS